MAPSLPKRQLGKNGKHSRSDVLSWCTFFGIPRRVTEANSQSFGVKAPSPSPVTQFRLEMAMLTP